jgi:carbon-monoxide dehydrogenase medium subunit
MKAPAFDYLRAASRAEALSALAQHGESAKLLAGGQSLVPALNLRLLAPEILIDLNEVPELKGVSVENGRLRLGALTRHSELERSALIREHAPLLAEAIRHVAHPAIRSRGTIGGNLAHADPASELPACAVALGAELVIAGQGGERRVAADDFFEGVYATNLAPDDILVAIEFPLAAPTRRHAFLELSRRMGDYALVGIACTADYAGGALRDLKPVFFAAGPRPTLAVRAAEALDGKPLDSAALDAAVEALGQDIEPEGDLQISAATRLHLARTLFRRAVAALAPEAPLARKQETAA